MCTLYERIQSLCKDKGVSGSRMCLDLGLSKSTLSDMKSGRKNGISTTTANKMADYLGVSVDYLLNGEEQKNNAPDELVLTEDEIRILSAFREMSPERQKALAELLGIADSPK